MLLELPSNQKLILNVAKWARKTRGAACGGSMLYNSRRNMCCLGQFCSQMGASKKEMKSISSPHELEYEQVELMSEHGTVTQFAIDAMNINDNTETDDIAKISKLKALCRQHCVELVIKNIRKAIKYKNHENY